MSTKTTSAVTPYHIQKQGRAEFIEQWRKHRRSVPKHLMHEHHHEETEP